MHLLDHMKKTLLFVSLLSLFGGTQAFARVQETRINFTAGGAAANASTPAATVTMDWWNDVSITTGGPAVRPSGTAIDGLSLMDTQGVTTRYTFGYTKTGSAGIWGYNVHTSPVNPNYNVPEQYRSGYMPGGNNGTISKYSVSGFTVGDTLDLAFGGLVNDGTITTQQNRYVITITGATIANINNDSEIYFSKTTASSWSTSGNSITLTIGDGNTYAQAGFAAMLSGLTMTSNTLDIQIDARNKTTGGVASGSGATYGLSYMSIIPEPATASLSLLGLAVLTLRRRRK
ncbi:hypothetical protein AC781_00120 [Akkermansia glycaniphila]|nr:hypothetical protein AC781_11150 [Akkermansia glycaniphila]OCA04143.1 hypothetical protein AC781_00120 [Akkermansia glycaniphila]